MLAPLTAGMATRLLSPSAQVLVASATPGDVDVPSLPWSEVHWPTLVSLMAYERAEVPVVRLLKQVPALVPTDVRQVTQGLERVARFRAAELSDAAAGVADALQGAQVRVLWLKGAALAMRSAEGFGVRSMGDLDLLVAEGDRDRARAALLASGWSSPITDSYDAHHHDAPLIRPGGLRLELHTALFPAPHPFADEPAEVWLDRGEWLAWGERRVLVLPPAWHVVHASAHWAWSHEGTVGTWQYLHDMHRLTGGWRVGGAEWEAVTRSAELVSAAQPVGWGLWTAARLAGLSAAETAVNRLRGRIGVFDGLVEREWVLAAFHSPAGSPSVRWSRFWWRRAMRGLGRRDGRWPWAAGRSGATRAEPEEMGGRGVGRRGDRWRRHLLRIWRS